MYFRHGAEGIRTPDLRRAKSEVSVGEAVGATAEGGRSEEEPITAGVSSGLNSLDGSTDGGRIPPQHTSSCHNPLFGGVRAGYHRITLP
jgi:hypothetical protein